jgi:hypothetical protein
MTKEARWSAVDLVENLSAIEQWRSTLSEKDRRRLVHPLSNVRRWRRSLAPKPEPDRAALAQAALDRFLACVHWAVLILIAKSNFVGIWTGRSEGFSPFRIRFTYAADYDAQVSHEAQFTLTLPLHDRNGTDRIRR